MEEASKCQFTPKNAFEAAQTALRLLGNASSNISCERRKAALSSLNPRLVDMADDTKIFANAAPQLFGEGFAKKAKERDEELKCPNQATFCGKETIAAQTQLA